MPIIMGTPGVVGFTCDGITKFIMNDLDSYPRGLGKDVVSFLDRVNREKGWGIMKAACKILKPRNPEIRPNESMIKKYDAIATKNLSGNVTSWGYLIGSIYKRKMLDMIYDGKLEHYLDGAQMVNGGNCDYGYLVNLDDMTLSFLVDGCGKTVGKVPVNNIPENWERFFEE